MLNSVAPSTSRQYSSYIRQYVAFCQLRNLTAFPLDQQNLVLFVSYLAKSVSHGAIQGHLAAIKFQSAVHGFSSLQEFPSFHRLYLTLHGIKRMQGGTYRKKKRLPITPNLLKVCNFVQFVHVVRRQANDMGCYADSFLWFSEDFRIYITTFSLL